MNSIDPATLLSTEVAYLGSFIAAQDRERDFYSFRSALIDTYADPFSAALQKALDICYQQAERAVPIALAEVMLGNCLVTAETQGITGQKELWEQVLELINYYAERGAKTLRQFRKYERAVIEQRRLAQLTPSSIAQKMEKIARKGGSSLEQAIELRSFLDSLIGHHEVRPLTYEWPDQALLFDSIPQEQRKLIGKPRYTLPPAWMMHGNVPVIRPGRLIVLIGATGDGKSAMLMQAAEWTAVTGRHVLVIHMEDTVRTILMRQTCRWIGATMDELERGDPDDKMAKMKAMREEWPGTITYKYLAGLNIQLIEQHTHEWVQRLEENGAQPGAVFLDYFQKVEVMPGKGENMTNAYNQVAERLKITAEAINVPFFVASQKNTEGDAMFSRSLEQKGQLVLSLLRERVKVRETVILSGQEVTLTEAGERSVWIEVTIKKNNDGPTGTQVLYFEAPRFRAFAPQWMQEIENGQRREFDVPALRPFDTASRARQNRLLEAWHKGYQTPYKKGQ